VLLHGVAEPPGRARERALEAVVREGLDAAAVVADEVMMVVMRVTACGLEARDAVAHVDPLHEPEGSEGVERPVHARDADGAARIADPVVDLLGGAAAALRIEVLDDRPARAAPAEPGGAEAGERVVGPARHRLDDSDSHVCYARPRIMVSRIVLVCAACASVLAAAGCGGSEGADDALVGAFYPLAFALRQAAPAGREVVDLTPPGAEPHDLELGARDVERVRDAELVVYAGGGFQPAVEDALESRDGTSLDVLDEVDVLRGDETGEADPHVWLDPQRYARIARSLAAALGRPRAADGFVARLEALDRELARGLAHCRRREIVTSHAAFAYLADRYDLDQVPLVGVTPEAEPDARDIEGLVDEVQSTGATTVFFEPLVSSRLAETVAREAGVETAVLDPIEGLTAEQQDAGADYFGVMRQNLAALRTALGCT
jgi:zinc transport system substrate-binding protein